MIVVLTLGRSGSSLIMQSLQELGVNVIGRKFDLKASPALQAQHKDSSPQGFFEQPEIYYGGAASDQFQAIVEQGPSNTACKMDAGHFVDSAQRHHWEQASASISAIFLSYRDPSEQAHSEFLGCPPSDHDDLQKRFIFKSRFLKNYTAICGGIEPLLDGGLHRLKSKVYYVNRKSAHAPDDYIKGICDAAQLSPKREQISAAISNIDPKLFRTRREEIDQEEREWATSTGADAVYAELERQARAQQNRTVS